MTQSTLERLSRAMVLSGLTLAPLVATANPSGGQVVAGAATITTQGTRTTVTSSPGAVINWQGFSIGPGEVTSFVQQSASSTVLNRVVGSSISSISGSLSSNGRVFLINPNGAVFTQGAAIDTAGFTVSTTNISNSDFAAGNHGWNGAGSYLSAASFFGQVQLSGSGITIGDLTIRGASNPTIASAGTISTTGAISGPAASTLNIFSGSINGSSLAATTTTSGGTLTLNGTSTGAGTPSNVVLSTGGTVALGGGGTLTNASGGTGGAITIAAGTATNTTARAITLTGGTGGATLNAGAIALTAGTGATTNAGAITLAGTATTTASGSTGGTTPVITTPAFVPSLADAVRTNPALRAVLMTSGGGVPKGTIGVSSAGGTPPAASVTSAPGPIASTAVPTANAWTHAARSVPHAAATISLRKREPLY